jgi:uncharacterized SAM-binding protein YcdF (DUF218 family)
VGRAGERSPVRYLQRMHGPKLRPAALAAANASRARGMDRHRALLAAFGASCSILGWLALGALTGLGKMPSLLFPTTLLVAVAGALLALTRMAILVWVATAIGLLVFSIVALTPFVTTLLPTRTLVRSDRLPSEPLDAVVVLSGGITPDSLLAPEALDRLLSGLALMRDSVAPVLVVTQPRRPEEGTTAAPDQARVRALVQRPFPMFTVDSVRTTRDEAVYGWALLNPRGIRRVAVVTSPAHTRRACETFEQVGFLVTCVPAVVREYSLDRAASGQERIEVFRTWLYERAATIEYRRRGWLAAGASR